MKDSCLFNNSHKKDLGIVVDCRLNMSQKYIVAGKKWQFNFRLHQKMQLPNHKKYRNRSTLFCLLGSTSKLYPILDSNLSEKL